MRLHRQFINSTTRLNRYRKPVLTHKPKPSEDNTSIALNRILQRFLPAHEDGFEGLKYLYARRKESRKMFSKAKRKARLADQAFEQVA